MVWLYPEPVFGCHFFMVTYSLSFEDVLRNIFWVLLAAYGFYRTEYFSLLCLTWQYIYPIFFIIFLYSAAISDFCAVKKKTWSIFDTPSSEYKKDAVATTFCRPVFAGSQSSPPRLIHWPACLFVDIALEKLQNHLCICQTLCTFRIITMFIHLCIAWLKRRKKINLLINITIFWGFFRLEYRKDLFMPFFIWRMLKSKIKSFLNFLLFNIYGDGKMKLTLHSRKFVIKHMKSRSTCSAAYLGQQTYSWKLIMLIQPLSLCYCSFYMYLLYQYYNNSTNNVSMIKASMTYAMQQKNVYAIIDMLVSRKINVSNPHLVNLARSHTSGSWNKL